MGFAGLPARSGAASSKTSSFTAANGSGRRFLGLRPSVPPDRTGEGGDRRRKAPAGDRHQRDLADHFRVGNEPSEDARDGRRKLRDKADAETGGDHHLNPVLTLAAEADLDCESVLAAALVQVVLLFTIHPRQIGLAGHIGNADPVLLPEAMAHRERDAESLAVYRAALHPDTEGFRLR